MKALKNRCELREKSEGKRGEKNACTQRHHSANKDTPGLKNIFKNKKKGNRFHYRHGGGESGEKGSGKEPRGTFVQRADWNKYIQQPRQLRVEARQPRGVKGEREKKVGINMK